MNLIEDVTLAEFYERYLERVRARGFRMLLLALIRDAELPTYYDDLDRYWDSLNDLTGRHVLFAVAGRNASDKFHSKHVVQPAGIAFNLHSGDFASAQTGRDHLVGAMDPEQFQYARQSQQQWLASDPYAARYSGRLLGASNTSQVAELASHLGLREHQVPCLHLTLLRRNGAQAFVFELNQLERFSIYAYCKDLIVALQDGIEGLEAAESTHARAISGLQERWQSLSEAHAKLVSRLRDHEKSIPLPPKAALRIASLQPDIERMQPGSERQNLFTAIASVCKAGLHDAAERRRLYALVNESRRSQHIDHMDVSTLHSLIDLSFSSSAPSQSVAEIAEAIERHKSIERDVAEHEPILDAARADLERARAARNGEVDACEATLIKAVEAVLTEFPRRDRKRRWDYFISYATQDRGVAAEVFKAVEKVGRSFMDHFCLVAGQNWEERIPSVQAASHTTIALISRHTDEAHYQVSEIKRAINLLRQGQHSVLPVYVERNLPARFGLEQIHSIHARGDVDGGGIVAQIMAHIQSGATSRA